MDRTSVAGDYSRFSGLAYVLVHEPITAEVIAVDAVLAAVRRSLSPDGPPGIQRAQRKLARQAMAYIRRTRFLRLLHWSKEKDDGLELPDATRKVWTAVSALRPRQQVAVVMARLEGATLAEIADVLDCSAAAANSHLERARKSLAAELGAETDLRSLLTHELRRVAQAYLRDHRPDPAPAEYALKRSGRWRLWGIALGAFGVGVAAAVVTMLRS